MLAFGDPFNGAPIKGYPSEKIKTFCQDSDGVCQGKFAISGGHMAYLSNGDVGEAIKFAHQVVAAPAKAASQH